ncbi:metallophosphoesterase family protein [Flavobacterium sp.]|uniref:metallophosphoesterase family protein n=1 Tax=Flavobacterium sp. TaxID=239 RepID=UPI003D1409E4
MRNLVIGDIHGGYKALIQVVEKARIQLTDKLIFLGDYVDGWSESVEVLDFLIALNNKIDCVFLRGNHDELLLHWLQTKHDNLMWLDHGGYSTVNAYEKVSLSVKEKHIAFLLNLKNYHLDEQGRLFVHAGFTNMKGVTHEHYPRFLYWDRTLWETVLGLDPNLATDSVVYPKRLKNYSEIYIGHTSVTQVGETTPMNRANVWNLDTGAAYHGRLTIMDIDTKQFWQSEPLFELYPDEKGRN